MKLSKYFLFFGVIIGISFFSIEFLFDLFYLDLNNIMIYVFYFGLFLSPLGTIILVIQKFINRGVKDKYFIPSLLINLVISLFFSYIFVNSFNFLM